VAAGLNEEELCALETDLLIEGIRRRYGHDLRHYSPGSLRRRLKHFQARFELEGIAAIQAKALRDPEFFAHLLSSLTVHTTEMFRDPEVFVRPRTEVVPLLATWPRINCWVAGCSTGEEVYSLAIMLEEEGLYERATILGTDIDPRVVETAREGVYPIERAREFTRNYQLAGGRESFAGYYSAAYGLASMVPALKRNVRFRAHDLGRHESPGQMQLILCRNVLIYFQPALQDRVVRLLHGSLVRGGFLALGSKESLRFTGSAEAFEELEDGARVYRRR